MSSLHSFIATRLVNLPTCLAWGADGWPGWQELRDRETATTRGLARLNTYGKPFPRDPFELEMQMAELRGAARVKLSKLLSHARLWTDSRGVRIKALRMTPAELSEAMLTGFVHWGINGAQVAGIRIEIKR